MNKSRLEPTIIQYSNEKNKQGVRDYFKGQYKFDQGAVLQPRQRQRFKSVNNQYILYHDRNKSQDLSNMASKQCEKNQDLFSRRNSKRWKTQGTAKQDNKIQQNRIKNANTDNFQLSNQSIRLPKIVKYHIKNPQQIQLAKLLKNNKKTVTYVCGNKKCPSKPTPVQHTPTKYIASTNRKDGKKKLIKLAPQVQIRKRYTPTFVCSRDNPLPCFKIFQTI